MKKIVPLTLFAMLFAFSATFAHASCPVEAGASCFFYGGDLDLNDPNQNGLSNENDAIVVGIWPTAKQPPYGAAVYQNFNYAGGTVMGLASNNLSGLNPKSAYWEIRSGISEGNGGILIASGTAATSNVPTGRSDFGFIEYTNFVGMSVSIGAGQYWMAVVPNDPGNANRSFNSDTDGLNSVGSQTTNQQYFNSAFFGANFTNTNNEGVFAQFSQAAYVCPEPSSLILLATGLVAAASTIRRQLSR